MDQTTRTIQAQKHIALVAHDHCKSSLMQWVGVHKEKLQHHTLYATGTTGNLVQRATGLPVTAMLSGPMGGDQQVGALISEGRIDLLIFFGTRSTRYRTIRMSKRFCASPPCGTFRSRPIAPPPTLSSIHRYLPGSLRSRSRIISATCNNG